MRIAVVGAGVTGLALSRRLVDAGHDVVVYDAGPAGGLAAGFEFPGAPGTYLEHYYHHIFRTDHEVVKMIESHGLGKDLVWRHSRSGLFDGSRVWPMEGPVDLLKLKPVGGVVERLRMGLSLRVFQKTDDWQQFDSITCEEFFARRGGTRGYKGLWEPLLKAKFGSHYADIPAAFLWGRIYPRSRSREKGKESLGYLTGGFARMAKAVVGALEVRGVQFNFQTRVRTLRRLGPDRFRVETDAGNHEFDRVAWTGHLGTLGKVLDPAEPALADHASRIKYIGACCLVLLLKRRLGDFYWINNLDPDVTFGGVIEHTNLIPPDHYAGLHVAYVINYLDPSDPQMSLDADQVFARHLPSLKRLYPGFDPSWVERKMLFKSPAASPLYDKGFLSRIPPFTGWSPGIATLGMPQVYPVDRNMNHCIEVANRADLDAFLGPQ